MSDEKTVYLVDDDGAVREALQLLLQTVGLNVVSFASPLNFLNNFKTLRPGCIVMDIRMPLISGLKLQEKLFDANCMWPVVVISGHGDIEACRKAFRNGAIDFLSKPVDEQDLIDAIQKAHAVLDDSETFRAERKAAKMLLSTLTAREKEVLELVSKGYMTKEIAKLLLLSPRTIESHRSNLSSKLGTSSVAELARLHFESESQ